MRPLGTSTIRMPLFSCSVTKARSPSGANATLSGSSHAGRKASSAISTSSSSTEDPSVAIHVHVARKPAVVPALHEARVGAASSATRSSRLRTSSIDSGSRLSPQAQERKAAGRTVEGLRRGSRTRRGPASQAIKAVFPSGEIATGRRDRRRPSTLRSQLRRRSRGRRRRVRATRAPRRAPSPDTRQRWGGRPHRSATRPAPVRDRGSRGGAGLPDRRER